jgi:hypothetical protein
MKKIVRRIAWPALALMGLFGAAAASVSAAEVGEVLSQQKISEDAGRFDHQLGVGDWFGFSVASLGDLDGDGVPDLAVGAPLTDGVQGADEGTFWILFLMPDGRVDGVRKFSPGTGPLAAPDAQLGRALANAGDIDGDGNVDLAVGAPFHDVGVPDRGIVWIAFLDDDGTVDGVQRFDGSGTDFDGDLDEGDAFGDAIAGIGDLNGDGVPDLAVGAPGDDDGGLNRGAVWILFMNDEGLVKDQKKISDTEGGFGGKLENGDGLGSSVASIGDLDGDGVVDLAVGAPFDNDGDGNNLGAVWILFLNANGTVKDEFLISKRDDVLAANLSQRDFFGWAVAGIGDLDEDGVPDIAVGAPNDDDGSGDDLGAFYVLLLNPDGSPKQELKVSATAGGFDGNLDAGDGFGAGLTAIGDLDGDGTTEITAGAPFDNDGDGADSGAAWVLFLAGPQVLCGDADADDAVTATDALISLFASVGSASCEVCVCDVNGSGAITAVDSQITLAAAVGTAPDLMCPACP